MMVNQERLKKTGENVSCFATASCDLESSGGLSACARHIDSRRIKSLWRCTAQSSAVQLLTSLGPTMYV